MKSFFAAALIAGTFAGFGAASAMTASPILPGVNPDVIQVAGGCGPGFHRGPYGGCRVNRGGPVVVVRPPIIVERRCPPGFFRGPRGGCRR